MHEEEGALLPLGFGFLAAASVWVHINKIRDEVCLALGLSLCYGTRVSDTRFPTYQNRLSKTQFVRLLTKTRFCSHFMSLSFQKKQKTKHKKHKEKIR